MQDVQPDRTGTRCRLRGEYYVMSDLPATSAADANAFRRCAAAAAAQRTRRNSERLSRVVLALSATFVVAAFSACTAEQLYGSGQAWQRNQCSRMPDKADADRCAAGTNTTYDTYKRQPELERK
jgi:hypothetical protein